MDGYSLPVELKYYRLKPVVFQLLVNDAWKKLFYSLSERPIGLMDQEIFPEPFASRFVACDKRVWSEHAPLVVEEIAPHADGPHTYRSVKFPIFDEAHRLIALGGVSTDITDLKAAHCALQHEENLLRKLIEVQEQEKRFRCQEFHDGVIQYAAGALMLLQSYLATPSPGNSLSKIEESTVSLHRSVEDGRRVIRGVRSAVLDDFGLYAALDDLAGQITSVDLMVPASVIRRSVGCRTRSKRLFIGSCKKP